MSKPRCLHTHLPFDRLTYTEDAKYMYIARQPADCLASFFYFLQCFPYHESLVDNFDEVCDLFLKGELDYNNYFDHLLCWYEQRKLPNVLFITYEGMKRDPKGAILKIAEFLDGDLVDELLADDESMLKEVLHHSSVQSMKNSVDKFFDESFTTPPRENLNGDSGVEMMNRLFGIMEGATKRGFNRNSTFVRKGVVGEGKVTLSEEQKERLNARILEKTAHSDVMDMWIDI